MNLRCAEIDALLAAFAANALSPAERLEVLEHLAGCREHDAELSLFREVLAALPAGLDDARPPERLRSELLAAFDRESGERSSRASQDRSPLVLRQAQDERRGRAQDERKGAQDERDLAETSSAAGERRPWTRRLPAGFGYGLAAALAVIALGLGAWNLSLQDDDEGRVIQSAAQSDGARLQVVYVPEQTLALLDVSLPPLPAGQVYQAWQLSPQGSPVSLGVLARSDGPNAFRADLSGASAVAISVEPFGGSVQPTTTPLLVSKL